MGSPAWEGAWPMDRSLAHKTPITSGGTTDVWTFVAGGLVDGTDWGEAKNKSHNGGEVGSTSAPCAPCSVLVTSWCFVSASG